MSAIRFTPQPQPVPVPSTHPSSTSSSVPVHTSHPHPHPHPVPTHPTHPTHPPTPTPTPVPSTSSSSSVSSHPPTTTTTSSSTSTTTSPSTTTTPSPGTSSGTAPGTSTSSTSSGSPPQWHLIPDERVIIEQACFDQCGGDWKFVVELLQDLLNDESKNLTAMSHAISSNDHKSYSSTAHGVKGAALNLHLPALTAVSKAAEFLGKELVGLSTSPGTTSPSTVQQLLSLRVLYLQQLQHEYKRVRAYLPDAERRAEEEGEGDFDDGQ